MSQLHKFQQTLLVLFTPVKIMTFKYLNNLEWFQFSVSNVWDLDMSRARWLKAKACVGKYESVESHGAGCSPAEPAQPWTSLNKNHHAHGNTFSLW